MTIFGILEFLNKRPPTSFKRTPINASPLKSQTLNMRPGRLLEIYSILKGKCGDKNHNTFYCLVLKGIKYDDEQKNPELLCMRRY